MKQNKAQSSLLVGLFAILTFCLVSVASAEETVGDYASSLANTGGTSVPPGHYGIMAKRANKYLTEEGPRTIFAEDMYEQLEDFFVVDIRLPKDYCKGHVPGAINIPYSEAADSENLRLLPTDTPIAVVCYTGHTASQVATIYNMLGYEAWTLRFAMLSWDAVTPTTIWTTSETQDIFGGDFPVEVEEVCE